MLYHIVETFLTHSECATKVIISSILLLYGAIIKSHVLQTCFEDLAPTAIRFHALTKSQ
jgi:hypothetical protein